MADNLIPGCQQISVDGFGPIYHFSTIDSTQTFARINAQTLPSPTAIVADQQTNGHGRKKRVWVSPPGCLMFSMIVDLSEAVADVLTTISPIICVRVVQYIRSLPGCGDVTVKWPNDVYWRGKKLCGILTDAIACGDEMKLIVGLGLNVTNDVPPEAVSLANILAAADELSFIHPDPSQSMAFIRDDLLRHVVDAVTEVAPFEEFQGAYNALMGPSYFRLPTSQHMHHVTGILECGRIRTEDRVFTSEELAEAEWCLVQPE